MTACDGVRVVTTADSLGTYCPVLEARFKFGCYECNTLHDPKRMNGFSGLPTSQHYSDNTRGC